jgi:Flp pilus assembly pilin Flp
MRRLIARLLRDEQGAETIEYAIVLGLVVVVAIALIGTFGVKVVARWTKVDSSL